jgi:Fur family transcriptional regulator, stress-responsive regulator
MSRRTEQRDAILEALRGSDRAVTAQELHGTLDGVGLATVYRNLQRLAEEGTADTLRRENGEQAFLICGDGHHHHLICRVCGQMVDVDCAVGDTPCLTASDDAGYEIDEAEVIYWGRCPDCQAAGATEAPIQRVPPGRDPT